MTDHPDLGYGKIERGPFTAADLDLAEGVILCRGGRSGRKIHAAGQGSSVTHCGHWMKAQAHYYRVESAHYFDLCERCFGKR